MVIELIDYKKAVLFFFGRNMRKKLKLFTRQHKGFLFEG